jgi:hypothetical protein
LSGAGARIRTADLLITSEPLYRLSYTGFQVNVTLDLLQKFSTNGKEADRKAAPFMLTFA